jgi:Tfp pilus assembly protein PilO
MLPDSPWKNGLLLVVACLVAIGYVALWFVPQQRELKRLRAELAEKKSYVDTAATFEAQLYALERELEQTVAFRSAWEAATPAHSDLSPLFAKIHQSVRGTGAAVTLFEPQNAVPRARLRQVPVHMHTLGAFGQVTRALVAVERVPGAVWIDDLKITQPREAGQKTQCEAKLVIFAAGAEISEESGGNAVR